MSDVNHPAADESCNWTQDSDANWDTQCGNIFTFTDGESPADHNIAFCGYCGKKIAQRSYQPELAPPGERMCKQCDGSPLVEHSEDCPLHPSFETGASE